jgi:glutamyl-tRNA reductase
VERALKLLHKGADPKQVLEALSQGLTNKLMHAPTQALNEATGEERRTLGDTISRLFRLRS